MSNHPPRTTRDFGFDPNESQYHFAVALRGGEKGEAKIEERFQIDPSGRDAPRKPVGKVALDAYRWSRISGPARAEFNRRLETVGQRSVAWKAEETLLAPHFGKELTLLAWAVEGADPTVIPNVIANWRGLAPEERWWLYTTVNATSGHPEHGRDRGWRKAIRIALAENPSEAFTPGTVQITEHDAKQPDGTHEPSSYRRQRGKGEPSADQLSLISDTGK